MIYWADLTEITVLTLGAEESIPAGLADALEGLVAGAVLTAWQRDALVALFAGVANATATLSRPLAVAIHRITATPTHGHLAEIALPAGQALYVAELITRVVRVHLVLLRLLAGLQAGGGGSSASRGRRSFSTYALLPDWNVCIQIDAACLTRIKVATQRIVAAGAGAGDNQ